MMTWTLGSYVLLPCTKFFFLWPSSHYQSEHGYLSGLHIDMLNWFELFCKSKKSVSLGCRNTISVAITISNMEENILYGARKWIDPSEHSCLRNPLSQCPGAALTFLQGISLKKWRSDPLSIAPPPVAWTRFEIKCPNMQGVHTSVFCSKCVGESCTCGLHRDGQCVR